MRGNRGKAALAALALSLTLLTACGPGVSEDMTAPSASPAVQTAVPTAASEKPPERSPAPSPTPEGETDPTPAPTPSVTPTPTPTPSPTPTSAPTPTPAPASPTPAPPSAEETTCTLSISCASLLDCLDELEEGKRALVPDDGWLLGPMEVPFEEGESVFDVLQRTCREQGIHMEFSMTPGLGTAYVEGIGNLYEFDGGDLSGWIYTVNGQSPNYGCSDYELAKGDQVAWQYTCDLGADVAAGIG